MNDASCKYLSPEDVAALLGVRVETVRDWLRSGHLPGSNVGMGARPLWRISESELSAWLEARRAKAAATA